MTNPRALAEKALAIAYQEGYDDRQHDEHEHRPGRKSTSPYDSPDYADGGVTAAAIEKEAEQPRPFTAADIEQLVTQNRYRVADAIRALYPEEPMATDVLAHAVMTALTEPPRPAWADLADTLRAIDPAETLSIDDLAEAAHEHGVRVASVGLTPTNPEEQS